MRKRKSSDKVAVIVDVENNALRVQDIGGTTAEFSVINEDDIKKSKPSSLFRRSKKNAEPIAKVEESEPVEQTVNEEGVRVFTFSEETSTEKSADEEDVRVFSSSDESSEEDTSIADTQELIPEELPTQPIPDLMNTQVVEEHPKTVDEDDKAPQILLDGFEEEAPRTETVTDEERLRRVRREQIEDFSQKREQLIEQEEQRAENEQRGDVVYPETPLEVPAEEDPSKSIGEETAKKAAERLATALRHCNIALFFSVVLEIILFLLTLISAVSPVLSMNPITYLVVQLVLFVALCSSNLSLLSSGLSRLFTGRASASSGVALASLVTLIHTAIQFINTTDLAGGATPLLTGVCGLGILLLSVAKRLETDRLYRAAVFASSQDEMMVYKQIDDPDLAEEIGRPALAIGEPRVAYYRLTKTVAHFAEDRLFSVKQMKWYLPLLLGLSAVISLVYFVLNGISSWQMSLTLFCIFLNVSAPALLVLAAQTALSRAATSARQEGAAIADHQTVDSYGSVHALALDAMDIFPEQSVLLHGIKTFSGTRIDDAILDAASVSVRAGGPLSHVFRRMIQNKVDMLRDVDTLVYEQDMGLSGWVSGRRVLIGNRKLLDNHGIDIPSKDYEDRYAINGRQLVYLSIAGELSAMFVVSYVADPSIKQRLAQLTNNRVTLLIRTCDQNITEQLVASTFDLNGFYVELINAPAGRSFEGLVDGVTETEKHGIVSNGDRCGLFRALTLCCRLKRGITVFSVLQTILSLLLVIFVGYSALTHAVLLTPVYLADILLGAALLSVGGALLVGKK